MNDTQRRRSVRRAWDAVAADYANARRADGPDAALLDELLADLPAQSRVLDVGCGDGRRTAANLVDGVEVVALDVSRVQLGLAREVVPGALLVQGDMTSLPLRADSVDAVTAYHSVFHVPRERHPRVYEEFARVLRPGGRLLTTVGVGRSETTRSNWLGSGHSMFWSTPGRDVTREQLREAGFEIDWERFVDDPLGSEALFAYARLV